MKRTHVLPGLAAASLILSSCGVYTATEPTNRSTLKVTVTRCDLGGSVEIVVDGNAGPYPVLSTPGEITMLLGPGAHTLTYRRDNREFGPNLAGDPFDLLRSLGPRETAVINAIDPPWACVAASSARTGLKS
jgi:hypothetical protein